jgi:hypothetical protein
MARHFFNLRYDGLLAAHNELASSASKQAVEGAQMFLGAHAHYYLAGRVPQRINDRAPGYEITDLARRAGSWEADFAINIFAEGVWDIVKYAFPSLIYDSYRAWVQGRVYEDPPFERRDPYLGSEVEPSAPSLDPVATRRLQQERLSRRVGRAIAHMTAGIGTSASVLEMTIDDHTFAVIECRVPLWNEDEVTEGVSLFRQTAEAARRRRMN